MKNLDSMGEEIEAFVVKCMGKLEKILPDATQGVHQEVKQVLGQMLRDGLLRMDLLSREEFEIQSQLLAKTREKLEALEQRALELERQLAACEGSA